MLDIEQTEMQEVSPQEERKEDVSCKDEELENIRREMQESVASCRENIQ